MSKCYGCQFSARCLPGYLGNYGCCKTCAYKIDCHVVFGGPDEACKRFSLALDPKIREWLAKNEPRYRNYSTQDVRKALKPVRRRLFCELGHEIREKVERLNAEREKRLQAYVDGKTPPLSGRRT